MNAHDFLLKESNFVDMYVTGILILTICLRLDDSTEEQKEEFMFEIAQ